MRGDGVGVRLWMYWGGGCEGIYIMFPVCQVVMEYVGGGNLSSRLRNPDIVPVTGEVSL